jgi:hypothetical protein
MLQCGTVPAVPVICHVSDTNTGLPGQPQHTLDTTPGTTLKRAAYIKEITITRPCGNMPEMDNSICLVVRH